MQTVVGGKEAAMGNNTTDWVIEKWVFPLPGAYQSFPDLYLSLSTWPILLAALVELCKNLFPSMSWFLLNAWGFHVPSPPALAPVWWGAPAQGCDTFLFQSPWLWWRHQRLSFLCAHGLLSWDGSFCRSINAFATRSGPTRRTRLPTITQGPVQHIAPTKSLWRKQEQAFAVFTGINIPL